MHFMYDMYFRRIASSKYLEGPPDFTVHQRRNSQFWPNAGQGCENLTSMKPEMSSHHLPIMIEAVPNCVTHDINGNDYICFLHNFFSIDAL